MSPDNGTGTGDRGYHELCAKEHVKTPSKAFDKSLDVRFLFCNCLSSVASDPGHWCFFQGVSAILAQSEG